VARFLYEEPIALAEAAGIVDLAFTGLGAHRLSGGPTDGPKSGAYHEHDAARAATIW
jgi:hypothetical protein